jgi:hypothetical protein
MTQLTKQRIVETVVVPAIGALLGLLLILAAAGCNTTGPVRVGPRAEIGGETADRAAYDLDLQAARLRIEGEPGPIVLDVVENDSDAGHQRHVVLTTHEAKPTTLKGATLIGFLVDVPLWAWIGAVIVVCGLVFGLVRFAPGALAGLITKVGETTGLLVSKLKVNNLIESTQAGRVAVPEAAREAFDTASTAKLNSATQNLLLKTKADLITDGCLPAPPAQK